MRLYEIAHEIENLIDYETGEILDIEALEQLEMARDDKLRNIIRLYKNTMAEAKALKEAKMELQKRQQAKEKTCERLLNYIDSCQAGQPYECTEGRLSYRMSKKTELISEDDFFAWDGRFIYGKSELIPDKDAIKEAIGRGENIPGWAIVEHNNASIK